MRSQTFIFPATTTAKTVLPPNPQRVSVTFGIIMAATILTVGPGTVVANSGGYLVNQNSPVRTFTRAEFGEQITDQWQCNVGANANIMVTEGFV